MATDISLLNNVVQITNTVDGTSKAYVQASGGYSFNAAGDILSLNLGGTNTYSIPLADLTVASAPVADAAAGYIALSSVFQK